MDKLEYFEKLVGTAPNEARARFGFAHELFKAERWEDAAREFRAYLELAEDEGNAWGRLAESLARLGRIDDAADAYLTGIDQAIKFGHNGMADEFRDAMELL
jgi:Flp pilus assembly protein TadD